MAVTVYKDTGFAGVFARLGPGFYSGRDLVGCPHQSTSCEDLDRAISSVRIDPNIIVCLSASQAVTASGGGARVLIGPAEIPDLAVLGMRDRVSSVLVVPFRAYDSAIPAPEGGVALFDSYSLSGRRAALRRGDFSKARLASEEVRMPGRAVVSLEVGPHVVAVLCHGDNFEPGLDAVMVVGPTLVEDLERLGMGGRVNSIRVLYTDPFDVPGRPTVPLGVARAYTPGGALGYTRPLSYEGGRWPGSALARSARDLLAPWSADPSDPSNWAGGLPEWDGGLPGRGTPRPPHGAPSRAGQPGGAVPRPRPHFRWALSVAVLFVLMVALAYAASARAPTLGGAAPRVMPPRSLDEVIRGLRAEVYSAA